MVDAPKTPSVPSVRAQSPAIADWTYGDKLVGVTPRYVLNKTPIGGTYVVDINDAKIAASEPCFAISQMPAGPKVLGAFVSLHQLEDLIDDAVAMAGAVFGSSNITSKNVLFTDADLNEDLVRVDIRVKGLSRERFRAARHDFEAKVSTHRDAQRLDRVVILTSRSDD